MRRLAFAVLFCLAAIALLLAVATMTGCHDDDDNDRPVSLCRGASLPVSCDGTYPKILDGGHLRCPATCPGITDAPCDRLYGPDDHPAGCVGYDCLHVLVCPCDGSPCASVPWTW